MLYFEGLTFPNSYYRRNWNAAKDAYPLYYGIQYVYSGPVALRIDHGKWYQRNGPVVFLTCPEHYYEYYTPGNQGREQLWVCFTGPRTAEYVAKGLFALDLHEPFITPSDPEQFKVNMEKLIEYSTDDVSCNQAVWLLEGLLLELALAPRAPAGKSGHHAFFLELKKRISEHPEKEFDFDAAAGKLSITRNHFNRLFRSYFRVSPLQFLLACRMRKAAWLLCESDLSIGEIANAVGVADAFYFSRLFRKQFLCPPRDYRFMYHEKNPAGGRDNLAYDGK